MIDFISLLLLGVSTFISTNIDDIFLLIVFFSNSLKFSSYQVVLGQYIGIGLLIAISIIASFVSLVVPSFIIGFMGIIPIVIGIIKLRENYKKRKNDKEVDTNISNKITKLTTNQSKQSLSFLSVATVTFSNDGDNIGIYTPLFASINSTILHLVILVAIFMIMTAVWCSIGYYLVNHSFLASKIQRIGHLILPFVLIGLGIHIMLGEFIK